MIDIGKELLIAMRVKKDAMAAGGDTFEIDKRLDALKDFKTKVIEFQTSGSGKPYDAAAELEILKRLIKQRQNSRDEYINADRQDLARGEAIEIMTLEKLLPELPNEAQIELEYTRWREGLLSDREFPYISKKSMGNAIKSVSEKFELVDKALVSKVVKKFVQE